MAKGQRERRPNFRPVYAFAPSTNRMSRAPKGPAPVVFSLAESLPVQSFQTAGAVAELLHLDTHAVEHGYPQVVERRVVRVADVPAGLDRATAVAGKQDRQVVVVV